jgi:predicted HTH domain antitoxin
MTSETMRSVALDDELASLLEQDRPLEEATREALVMDLFRRGKVSGGKACELLGLSRPAFMARARELGTPVLLTTEEEWRTEKAIVDAWLQ